MGAVLWANRGDESANDDADATFLKGHAAAIKLNIGGKNREIGRFGILHPSVLQKFELPYPVSTLEINLEVFL